MPQSKLPVPDNISEAKALADTPIRYDRPASDYRLSGSALDAPALRKLDEAWVEKTLQSLTIEELVGQLFITTGTAAGIGEDQLDRLHIGGFIFMGNSQRAADIVERVNALQRHAKNPLWFSIDSEAGLGARVADATIFPLLMAFGASDSIEDAEWCGRITARESRALGLHVTFGPVVDVNTEPNNPIISTRSYGEDPDLVTRLGRAHIRGTAMEGNLCTLKHYPGHGASAGDSHNALPQIPVTREELDRDHLAPFRSLIATGDVDLIMTAHLAYPLVDGKDDWPATLSPYFNIDILRNELGFEGLLVSDAFDMRGITGVVEDPRERGVIGLEAGLDVILGVANEELDATWQGIVDAVRDGRITRERLELSVRRILRAKSRAGLPEMRFVDEHRWEEVLNHPEHRAIVKNICDRAFAVTMAENPSFVPFRRDEKVLVIPLGGSQRIFYRFPAELFTKPFVERCPAAELFPVPHKVEDDAIAEIIAKAEKADRVLVVGYDWWRINSASQLVLLERLIATGLDVTYISFGSPYHAAQIPGVKNFLCAFSSVREMQETVAAAITE